MHCLPHQMLSILLVLWLWGARKLKHDGISSLWLLEASS